MIRHDDFEPVPFATRKAVQRSRKPVTYRGLQRLKKNRLAVAGGIIICLIALWALIGPAFSPYTYDGQNFAEANAAPSVLHWFGTDSLGRDLYTRVLYGARISLSIGIVAALINVTIGVIYGGIAGFIGGKTDRIMMHIVDVLYSVPVLLYVILLMVVFKPGLLNIYIALGIAYWLNMARIVRGQILSLKTSDYITAARSCNAGSFDLLRRHLLPNSAGPIVAALTLSVPDAIFTEAFLSFIGLGVSAPMASWGVLTSEGINSIRSFPFQLFFPAAALCLTMLGFVFLGDGLYDLADPQTGKDGNI